MGREGAGGQNEVLWVAGEWVGGLGRGDRGGLNDLLDAIDGGVKAYLPNYLPLM